MAAEVHGDGPVEGVEGDVQGVGVAPQGAGREVGGIGMEDVEPPEGLDGQGHHLPHRPLVGDVDTDAHGPTAGLGDLLGHADGGVAVQVADHDTDALLAEPHRRGRSDPSSTPGHDRHLVLQTPHQWSLSAARSRRMPALTESVIRRSLSLEMKRWTRRSRRNRMTGLKAW